MIKFINSFLVLCLLVSAWLVYRLEHTIKQDERAIAAARKQIRRERDNLDLLNAEWAILTRPERIERLARQHLGMRPVTPAQMITENELAGRLPDRPAIDPANTSEDPIAAMLKELGR